jgi:hypothetical protein
MKYTVEMGSGAMIYTPSFIKIGLGIQKMMAGSSPGVKRPGLEADRSPQSSAEVKKYEAITSLPHMSSWHSTSLIKYRDNFTRFHMPNSNDSLMISIKCIS